MASFHKLITVKHHITRFEKRDIQRNRRSVFKKFVEAFCQVNNAYINSPGLKYIGNLFELSLYLYRVVWCLTVL